MARRVGPVKLRQYSLEFKLKAVKLSQLKVASRPQRPRISSCTNLWAVCESQAEKTQRLFPLGRSLLAR